MRARRITIFYLNSAGLQYLATTLVLCFSFSFALADDWPQWMGEKRDGLWRGEKGVHLLKEFGPPSPFPIHQRTTPLEFPQMQR